MKKLLSTLVCLAVCGAAYSASVAVELDTRHSKIQCTKPEGLPSYQRVPKQNFFLEFNTRKEANLEWTQYTISFVPDKTGYVVLGLCSGGDTKAGMNDWIEFDKLELTNATLNNPSFEFKSVKGDVWAWRYYNKDTPKFGKEDAADGKNYIAVTRSFSARQGMHVTAGKKVTIKFMARSGGMTPRVKQPAFFSDQTAARAK